MRFPRTTAPAPALAAALVLGTPGLAGAQTLRPAGASGGAAPRTPVVVAKPRGLSPRLAALAEPAVRALRAAERAKRLSLPERGAGSIVRIDGDPVVQARVAAVTPAVLRALRAAGAEVLGVDDALHSVTAKVAETDLARVAAVSGVENVSPDLAPAHNAERAACAGSVTSEADAQLRAADARAEFGVDGTGVTVGIISDSFDRAPGAATRAAADVASGDLPGVGNPCGLTTPVQVLSDTVPVADEGRAMAQVVHDLAPGAKLAFSTGLPDQSAFVQGVSRLRAAGARVIVDDLAFPDEPFFQAGPASVAVSAAAAAGVAYFSSAANHNLNVGGRDKGSYEAPAYRPTSCPALPVQEADCMDYDPGAAVPNLWPFQVAPGQSLTLNLQWAEPWFGVRTDLDVFVLDQGLNTVLAAGTEDNASAQGTQRPFEFVSYRNTTATAQVVWVVVARFSGAAPRLKWQLVKPRGQVLDTATPLGGDLGGPALYGHNGAIGALAVAATPYDDAAKIEDFSSRGPVTHYFRPVTSTTPAAPLAAPEVTAKPDVAATDGAATTFFAERDGPTWRFYGTSEAAPHAAAVAALQFQEAPAAGAAAILAAQKATARPVGAFGPAAAGAGLIDARAAVAAVKPPPVATPAPTVATPTPVAPPRPGDTTRPTARALTSRGKPGAKLRLRYRVGDDSGRARVTIEVYRASRRLRVLRVPSARVRAAVTRRASWRAPRSRARFAFCVTAVDPAGNRSRRSCARIVLHG